MTPMYHKRNPGKASLLKDNLSMKRPKAALQEDVLQALCEERGFHLIACGCLENGFFLLHAEDKKTRAELIRVVNPHGSEARPALYFGYRTPPFDNSGVFHVREHLAFEDNPTLFHFLRASAGVHNVNAETGGAHTSYYMEVTPERLHMARNYLLQVVGQKQFSERKIAEQTGKIFREYDDAGNCSAVVRGRLHTEMMGRSLEASWLREQKLWELFFPRSLFARSAGGEPEDIRRLSGPDLAFVDRYFYGPKDLILCESGKHDIRETLESYRSYLDKIPHSTLRKNHFPAPVFHNELPQSEVIEVPGNTKGLCFAWRIYTKDPVEIAALFCLESALADRPGSPLRKLVQKLRNDGTPSIREVNLSSYGPYHIFRFEFQFEDTLPKEALLEAGRKLLDNTWTVLQSLQRRGLPKSALYAKFNDVEHEHLLQDGNPRNGMYLLEALFQRHVVDLPLLDYCSDAQAFEQLREQVKHDPNFLPRFLQKHLSLPGDIHIGNPPNVNNCIVAVFHPDESAALRSHLEEVFWIRKKVRTPQQVEKLPRIETNGKAWAKRIQVPRILLGKHRPSFQAAPNLTQAVSNVHPRMYFRPTEIQVPELRLLFSTDHLKAADRQAFYAFASLLSEIGSSHYPGDTFGEALNGKTAGIEVFLDMFQKQTYDWKSMGDTFVSFVGLAREENFETLCHLLLRALESPNFTDIRRIEERLSARINRIETLFHEQLGPFVFGHIRSLAGFSPLAKISDEIDGLAQLYTLRELRDELARDPDGTLEYLQSLWTSTIQGERSIARVLGRQTALEQFERAYSVSPISISMDALDSLDEKLIGGKLVQEREKRFSPRTIREGYIVNNPACCYTGSILAPHLPESLFPSLIVATKILQVRREIALVRTRTHDSSYSTLTGTIAGAPVLTYTSLNEANPIVPSNTLRDFQRVLHQGEISRTEIQWAIASALADLAPYDSPYQQGAAELVWLLANRDMEVRERFAQSILNTSRADLRLIGQALGDKRCKHSEVIFGPQGMLETFEAETGRRLELLELEVP